MSFLFGKKKQVQALAETLEDAREVAKKLMQQPKYRDYAGAEPMLEVLVRVLPEGEPPFEAKMKVGLTKHYVLGIGVRVQVQYTPGAQPSVTMVDDVPAIMARNPQIIKKDSP